MIEITVPFGARRRPPGIVVHRSRTLTASEVTRHRGIPVTTPTCTLVDLAARLPVNELEAAINAADKQNLLKPETLRGALDELSPRPGLKRLRETLDRRTFVFADSELERRFVPIAFRAGLPKPETQRFVNAFRVDFYWPELGLVVEADSLRFHRTPAEQAADALRDQTHTASGMTALRFTHGQIRYQPGHVEETLATVARRLRRQRR